VSSTPLGGDALCNEQKEEERVHMQGGGWGATRSDSHSATAGGGRSGHLGGGQEECLDIYWRGG
jgi:hypothetical protein